jgi:CheY-like chemotaxis protein
LLKGAGMRLERFVSLDEAEARKSGGGPAMVLLDIDQDLDGGVAAIERIKRLHRRAPIAILTATMSREFGGKILSLGVQYYFSHDFCEKELIELTRSLTEGSAKRGEETHRAGEST